MQNKKNGSEFSSGNRSGGTGAEPPKKYPPHKRALASLAAERVVGMLRPLSAADLWLLADEICQRDEDLCRRMAYALGKRICDSNGDEPR